MVALVLDTQPAQKQTNDQQLLLLFHIPVTNNSEVNKVWLKTCHSTRQVLQNVYNEMFSRKISPTRMLLQDVVNEEMANTWLILFTN